MSGDDETLTDDCEALRWLLRFTQRDKARLVEKAELARIASARFSILFAAVERLHSSVEKAGVHDAITDILRNVVGAERVEIFGMEKIADGAGIVGSTVASGSIFLRRDDPSRARLSWEESMLACIPLHVGAEPVGAIAIFGLCEGKEDFTPIDLELFSLLARHAAIALRVSEMSTA